MLARLLRLFQLDRAVILTLANTSIAAIGLATTTLLVGKFLTPMQQGYYYTFASVLTIQVFFELGFNQCVLQFASHEAAHLRIVRSVNPPVEGDPDAIGRLSSLYTLATRWYTVAAICVLILGGAIGHVFFTTSRNLNIDWAGSWWLLCITTALLTLIQPKLTFIEGCNHVPWTAKNRLFSNIAKYTTISLAIVFGGGLYASAFGTAAAVSISAWMLYSCWNPFFKQLKNTVVLAGNRLDWRREVLPFQWKIAVSWLSGFFIFSLVNPIIFSHSGPVEAGRFGMTWTILQGISTLSSAWANTRVPLYGALVAKKDWNKLDAVWLKTVKISLLVAVLGVSTFLVAVFVAERIGLVFVQRLLSTPQTSALAVGFIVNQLIFNYANLLRSHKKEPYMGLSVTTALSLAVALLLGVRLGGVAGACLAYGLTILCVSLPMAFWIFRRERGRYRYDVVDTIGSECTIL